MRDVRRLMTDLAGGDRATALDAATALSNLPRLPIKRIINVLHNASATHNREAAAYALSWVFHKKGDAPLRALLDIFNRADEDPAVLAQALEGIGLHGVTKRHRLWANMEGAVLRGLSDTSAEVRFWACYAAGQLRMRAVLPRLQELADGDGEICPGWWLVSEEAADAIEWIHGRDTPARAPVSAPAEYVTSKSEAEQANAPDRE